MSIDNLLDLIIQYKEAAQLIETAQAEQETIKAQIKAEMAQRNTNDLQDAIKSSCRTSPAPAWTAKLSRPLPLPYLPSILKSSPVSA